MAMYEYLCENCKTTTDTMRAVDDRDTPCPCEKCGGETARITVPKSISVFWAYPTTDGKKHVAIEGPTVDIYHRVPEQRRKEATRHVPVYSRQGDTNQPVTAEVTTEAPPTPGATKAKT